MYVCASVILLLGDICIVSHSTVAALSFTVVLGPVWLDLLMYLESDGMKEPNYIYLV